MMRAFPPPLRRLRSRPSWLRCLALVAFASVCPAAVAETRAATNVLVFFVDDLRPELGAYGVEHIQTPHMDQLAATGMLFERAYCQQAICAPSRISMMAGKYPDRLGIQDLKTQLRRNLPDAMSLPRHFAEAGYKTLSYGKVYHHNRDDLEYWSDLPERPGVKYADPEVQESIRAREEEAKKRGMNTRETWAFTTGPPTEIAAVADEVYQDGAVALQAMESLAKHREEAFFMCVGFAKPHLPFAAPKRYWDLYKRERFDVPHRTLPEGAPAIAFTPWGELRAYQGMPKEGFLSDEQTRELRHGYAASVSYADAQIGKVMAELERLGLRENTVVVLWGDHGYKLGDHGQWCKHTNFEIDARVPFLVSAPGFPRGVRTHSFVEMIDIFPTLAELTGHPIPEGLDGKSLVPLLGDPSFEHRTHALSEYRRGGTVGYSLRNQRWRYTEWVDSETGEVRERELYDHAESQLSRVNLVDHAELAEVVSELSRTLDTRGRVAVKPLVPRP